VANPSAWLTVTFVTWFGSAAAWAGPVWTNERKVATSMTDNVKAIDRRFFMGPPIEPA
jgi:hypothetical protein